MSGKCRRISRWLLSGRPGHDDTAYVVISVCYWLRGVVNGVRRMNEVNPRRARSVLGRVTVFGRVCHLGV